MERCVQGLMLSAQRDAVELEAHCVPRAHVPPERAMEAKSDFFLAYDVDVTLEPPPYARAVRLDKNDVTCNIREFEAHSCVLSLDVPTRTLGRFSARPGTGRLYTGCEESTGDKK